jgi:hypothetical protein
MSREPPELARLLGAAREPWDALRAHLDGLDGVACEWKFYGEKYGWQLKVVAQRRALLYLIPRPDHFTAALALRPDAIEAVRASGLPAKLLREIEQAREAPEGRPARVEVRGMRELAVVKTLIAAKLTGRRRRAR